MHNKFRRIGAIAVIGLLLSLYVICFIAALIGSEKAQIIFKATLGLTVALPVLLYIFILFLKAAKHRAERAAEEAEKPGDSP